MIRKIFAVLVFFVFSFSFASASIIDANVRRGGFDIGVGTGFLFNGGNIEYGISDNLSIGGDYVTADLTLAGGYILELFGESGKLTGQLYDVHLNYQIVEGGDNQPFNVSILGGIGGTQVEAGGVVSESKTIAVGGLCLSSPMFSDDFIARLNLVVGPPLGAEIAWKISENFEFNAGVSAIGIFGMKISF
jgi:hypothetical protein